MTTDTEERPMSNAVRYAHLVGKYVRMERPADEVELSEARASGVETGDNYMVGCAGVVAAVWDADNARVGGPSVEVMMDYGMGYPILLSEQSTWRFAIFDSDQTAREMWASGATT